MRERRRQALPAIFGRRRQPEPAAFGELFESFLEALGRGDAAVGIAFAAFEIANPVEGLQHLLCELCSFAQNRIAHIGGCVREAGKVVVAVDLEDVVEQEFDFFNWRFVDRHSRSPGWVALDILEAFDSHLFWK